MFRTRQVLFAFATTLSLAAQATEVDLTADVVRVRYFNGAYQGHHAGDFEIVLSFANPGTPWPTGVRCADHSAISTLRAGDPARLLLDTLVVSQEGWQVGPMTATVSDDPAKQAIPDRCSLISIQGR